MNRRVLLVPSVAKGNGSGHLVRCLSLARKLGTGAAIFVPESKTEGAWSAAELSLSYSREFSGVPLVSELNPDFRWDLVILDRRATTLDELAFWERLGPVMAIDEGGSARSGASYLLDVLPRVRRESRGKAGWDSPNKASLSFLDLPEHRREAPRQFNKILLSFGGEDPAGLALILTQALLANGLAEAGRLTVVSGALRNGAPQPGLEGAILLGPIQDLKEHLSHYDLVFTQFGLTAFEAAFAGCGVILLNPGVYHRRLAIRAGFPEIGFIKPDIPKLRRLLANPAKTVAMTAAVAPQDRESLASFSASLSPSGPRFCPRCGSLERRAVFRNQAKSYFRCGSCELIYLLRFSEGRENPYKEEYFFEEYRKQYGRSYLEDWSFLTILARTRLDLIEGLAKRLLGRKTGLSVLDVGCAYGPFLAAARDKGQEAFGLDVAEEAARYVSTELGIPAAAGDFCDPTVAATFGGPFDVISMWYVIEHFIDLDRALRNAAALLRPGGILALSTPSGEGVSARFDREGFFSRSPEDHVSVWEPSRCRGILKAYGFRIQRIRITGHHPERIPVIRELKEGWLRRAAIFVGGWISRLWGLGDTFEIYAVRESSGTDPLIAPPLARRERARPES